MITLNSLAPAYCASHTRLERVLLSCGYNNPKLLFDAAREHKLTCDSFTGEVHGLIFSTIIECHKWGIKPTATLVAAVLDRYRLSPVRNKHRFPEELHRWLSFEEDVPFGMDNWAKMTALAAKSRNEIRNHWKKAGEIMSEIIPV